MSNNNVVEVVENNNDEVVENVENVENVTPYKAAKIINERLIKDGVEKVLPPQMFYNYTIARVRSGKKPFIEIDENNKISMKSLNEWYNKYVAKIKK